MLYYAFIYTDGGAEVYLHTILGSELGVVIFNTWSLYLQGIPGGNSTKTV
jgi:hypothetical protein